MHAAIHVDRVHLPSVLPRSVRRVSRPSLLFSPAAGRTCWAAPIATPFSPAIDCRRRCCSCWPDHHQLDTRVRRGGGPTRRNARIQTPDPTRNRRAPPCKRRDGRRTTRDESSESTTSNDAHATTPHQRKQAYRQVCLELSRACVLASPRALVVAPRVRRVFPLVERVIHWLVGGPLLPLRRRASPSRPPSRDVCMGHRN